jgi:hypothetical protein
MARPSSKSHNYFCRVHSCKDWGDSLPACSFSSSSALPFPSRASLSSLPEPITGGRFLGERLMSASEPLVSLNAACFLFLQTRNTDGGHKQTLADTTRHWPATCFSHILPPLCSLTPYQWLCPHWTRAQLLCAVSTLDTCSTALCKQPYLTSWTFPKFTFSLC